MDQVAVLREVGVSLAIGLLIGTERGWNTRALARGTRVAGIRTFGLIGLLGGLSAVLARTEGVALLVAAFLAAAALIVAAYVLRVKTSGERGATTEVAALVTFLLGAAPPYGYGTVAAAGAVTVMVLLGLKQAIHRAVEALTEREIYAAFKLLFLILVLLPVLPNEGLGPWGTLNPHEILWMVILIAGISFVGYFAVKWVGAQRGLGLTALLGGLVSSTAVTLNYSRLGRGNPGLHGVLSAGIVAACATMFPRILVEVGVVNAPLLTSVGWGLAAMAVVAYAAAALLWRRARDGSSFSGTILTNPLELGTAIRFAALLAAIMLLAEGLERSIGAAGVYLLAAFAGLGDLDAITLSLARQSRDGMDSGLAARGILLAAAVNTCVKIGLVAFLVGGPMARRVALALGLALLAGLCVHLLHH